jgi:hypothetical protein
MMARAGFSVFNRRVKLETQSDAPSISMKTPCAELTTQPSRLNSVANR